MFEEKSREKRFGEYIGSHVRGWNPSRLKRAFRNMVTDKVVLHIYMFRMRRNGFGFNEHESTLIIAEERERLWYWQIMDSEEQAHPESLLHSMRNSVVFQLC